MDKVALGLVVAVVVGVIAAIVFRELRRRAAWLTAARSALGEPFAAFARRLAFGAVTAITRSLRMPKIRRRASTRRPA